MPIELLKSNGMVGMSGGYGYIALGGSKRLCECIKTHSLLQPLFENPSSFRLQWGYREHRDFFTRLVTPIDDLEQAKPDVAPLPYLREGRLTTFLDDILSTFYENQGLARRGQTFHDRRFGKITLKKAKELKDTKKLGFLMDLPDSLEAYNLKDRHGCTLLMWLVGIQNGDAEWEEILDLLLKKPNLELNASDEFGRTALHYATLANCHGRAKKLIEAGLDVNQLNKDQHTPLDGALCYLRYVEEKSVSFTALVKYLISQGCDLWNTSGENQGYTIDLAIGSWPICEIILDNIPKERQLEYVTQNRKKDLLFAAMINGKTELVAKLRELGLKCEDLLETDGEYIVNSILQKQPSAILDLDIGPLIDRGMLFQTMVIIVSNDFNRYGLRADFESSLLVEFTKRYKGFYTKIYPINVFRKPCCSTPYTKQYANWTILSQFIAFEDVPLNHRDSYLRFLLTQPDVVVSEISSQDSLDVIPPLIAAALSSRNEFLFFHETLELLTNAKVRTRHCFSLLTVKWPIRFEEIVDTYFRKGFFRMEDLFEDDLELLYRAIKLYPISRQMYNHDARLECLLTKRLQHSTIISTSNLRELLGFLKPARKFKKTRRLLKSAIDQTTVRSLFDNAKLALKKKFKFYEEDLKNHLEKNLIPQLIVELTLNGQ